MRIELPQRMTKERPSRLTRYVRTRCGRGRYGRIRVHHQRPYGQAVRRDGRDHPAFERRLQYRTSGGKVVGSGAGRGGDEESVGEVVGEEIAVDFRSDIDHGRSVFLQYRHLIERVGPYLFRHRFAFYAQEHAGFGYEAPVAQRVHERDGVGDGGMGEEAEVARVYAEYRDAPVGYPLGGPEESAVSSEAYGGLGLGREARRPGRTCRAASRRGR